MKATKAIWVSTVLALLICWSVANAAPRKEFPSNHRMVNLVKDFLANGSDQLSDQAAFEAAIAKGANFPNPKTIYLPAGTYIVENVLSMGGYNLDPGSTNCCVSFQGQGPEYTVIKLKDNAAGYGNASTPKALIVTPPGNMSFRYNIFDLKVEIGNGNPGAIAVDYIVNNQGAMDNVNIVSNDRNAFVGLDMTRQWPGPCLIKNVTIDGFVYGIRLAQGEYGPTFDGITLNNQKTAGWKIDGNIPAIQNLKSINTVPAISMTGGMLILVNGDLRTPQGQQSAGPAIDVQGTYTTAYVRNVSATGYSSVLKNRTTAVTQNPIVEYSTSGEHKSLFGDAWGSLKLEIKNAPDFHDNDTSKWVSIRDHLEPQAAGTTPRPSLRKAMEYAAANGKTTVYVPYYGAQAPYPIYNGNVSVPPQVKKISGFNSTVMCDITTYPSVRLMVDGTTTDPLIIENIRFSSVSLLHRSSRPVVIKHSDIDSIINAPGAGDLFVEDMSPVMYLENPQKVWMRQFNPERLNNTWATNRLVVSRAQVWILGLKSEGAGNIFTARNGALVEMLGTLLYPVVQFTAEMAAMPAFIIEEACASMIYDVRSYAGAGNMYTIDVREIRNGVTRTLNRSQVGGPMQLYVANKGCTYSSSVQPSPIQPLLDRVALQPVRFSSLGQSQHVPLPAGADRIMAFTLRGEKIWEYSRCSAGQISVEVPKFVRAAGIIVVEYGRN